MVVDGGKSAMRWSQLSRRIRNRSAQANHTAQYSTYPVTITAANGVAPDAVQRFTLIVGIPPTITSANTAVFRTGTGGGPRVYILSGQLLMGGSDRLFAQPVANFFVANNSSDRGGVRLVS